MTERLYYNNPGLVEFDAVILSTESKADSWITTLDRSAFYPTSGGQSADRGELGASRIVDVVESDAGEVLHLTPTSPGTVGERVRGVVNEERRWKHRQMHTAQHIVSQVAIRLFNMETVSVHLGDDYGAVEFESGELKPDDLARLELEVNQVIRGNARVEILNVSPEDVSSLPLRKTPSRSGAIRVIKIGDLDWSACGGTHCDSSAQVGMVKLIGAEKMRGHTLLKFLSGAQTIADYASRFEITDRLSKLYSCSVADLPAKYDKLVEENKQLRKDLTSALQRLIPIRAGQLAASADRSHTWPMVIATIAVGEADVASQLATQIANEISGLAALVCSDKLYLATPTGGSLHAGNIAKALSTTLGIRGGGSAAAAQIGGIAKIEMTVLSDALLEAMKSA